MKPVIIEVQESETQTWVYMTESYWSLKRAPHRQAWRMATRHPHGEVESITEQGIEEGEEASWLVKINSREFFRFWRPQVVKVVYEDEPLSDEDRRADQEEAQQAETDEDLDESCRQIREKFRQDLSRPCAVGALGTPLPAGKRMPGFGTEEEPEELSLMLSVSEADLRALETVLRSVMNDNPIQQRPDLAAASRIHAEIEKVLDG